MSLRRLLKELHSEGPAPITCVEPAQDLQLIEMMLETIMGLSDEHDAAFRELVNQALECEPLPCRRRDDGRLPVETGGLVRARHRGSGIRRAAEEKDDAHQPEHSETS